MGLIAQVVHAHWQWEQSRQLMKPLMLETY